MLAVQNVIERNRRDGDTKIKLYEAYNFPLVSKREEYLIQDKVGQSFSSKLCSGNHTLPNRYLLIFFSKGVSPLPHSETSSSIFSLNYQTLLSVNIA